VATKEPATKLDDRFSEPGATATAWTDARQALEEAKTFFLSTVRPDGRPHATTLIAVWVDDALYFCTGPGEQKAKNLEQNPHCVLATGNNAMEGGLDLVVEGDAVAVTDKSKLQRIADAYEAKYGSDWHFDVGDGGFEHEAGNALVFEVSPAKALGFAKGDFSQTTWRF
jgi:general stress protein 26